MIKIVKVSNIDKELKKRRCKFKSFPYIDLEKRVEKIINDVRNTGDRAIISWTYKLDKIKLKPEDLKVAEEKIKQSINLVEPKFVKAISEARRNIERFHKRELRNRYTPSRSLTHNSRFTPSYLVKNAGQRIIPLETVGVYIPGGTAAYPSTILMTVIPAQIAGVKRIVLTTPPTKTGAYNPYTLATSFLLGIKEIYAIGGAQAIASLAFGTKTVPAVDKIVGSGNIYVTLAKKYVYGVVDIDMLAGPSELVVWADKFANPSFIAADLLSQSEHNPDSFVSLVTTEEKVAKEVQEEIKRQIKNLNRREIIKTVLKNSCIYLVDKEKEAVQLVNEIAPEHLELMIKDAETKLNLIKNAGCILIGDYSSVVIGDYFAGPSHVLPTGGSARFFSPLSVDDFLKRSSLINYDKKSLKKVAKHIIHLAEVEGLTAHSEAIKVREKTDYRI